MNERIDFTELKTANKLPSPKGVRLNMMRLCQRTNLSMADLATQIRADPVLAGLIIKLANVANPNRIRPIVSISTDVLILVGVQAIRQVVLGISLVSSYQQGGCAEFDYMRFWSRSMGMACAAQALAGAVRIVPVAEMFSCGLLAGIGSLGLATVRPHRYGQLLREQEGCTIADLTRAEGALFGFDHLSLTVAMMADWNIPRLFTDAVLFHEAPDGATFAVGSRQSKLVHMLHLAAFIADLCVASDDQRQILLPLIVPHAAALDIDHDTIASLLTQISREWVEWGNVLQVPTRALPMLGEPGAAFA
ncbi:MAG: HDOD domain-containing protein [Herminiimonas sp.]|nr:HDOD domain-containing protein [Herminiimonas sp.]